MTDEAWLDMDTGERVYENEGVPVTEEQRLQTTWLEGMVAAVHVHRHSTNR
jgi:hypothetical protein